MKHREGFVSNSSSSSFIVVFPKKPQSVKEMKKRLFNGKDGILECYQKSMSHDEISDTVYRDFKGVCKTTKKRLAKLLSTEIGWTAYKLEKQFICDHNTNNDIDFLSISEGMIDAIKAKAESEIKHKKKIGKFLKSKGISRRWDIDDPDIQKELKILEQAEYAETWPMMDIIQIEVDKVAEIKAQEFIDEHKDWWYGIVEYSDDCQTLLEHGGIFNRLEHIQISHH